MSIVGEWSRALDDKYMPRVATILPPMPTRLNPYQSVKAEANGDNKNRVPTASEPTKMDNTKSFNTVQNRNVLVLLPNDT